MDYGHTTHLLLELKHLLVLLILPHSELLRVLLHLPHQLYTLTLHSLQGKRADKQGHHQQPRLRLPSQGPNSTFLDCNDCRLKTSYYPEILLIRSATGKHPVIPGSHGWAWPHCGQRTLWAWGAWTAPGASSSCLWSEPPALADASSVAHSAWRKMERERGRKTEGNEIDDSILLQRNAYTKRKVLLHTKLVAIKEGNSWQITIIWIDYTPWT